MSLHKARKFEKFKSESELLRELFLSNLGTDKQMKVAAVKYGGSALARAEYIERHAEIARDLLKEHQKVIVVVSGAGDITDRLDSSLEEVEKLKYGIVDKTHFQRITDPSYVFSPWEDLYKAVGSPKCLGEVRSSVYNDFGSKVRDFLPQVRTEGERNLTEAVIHLYPEQLQAELVNCIYRKAGLESICVNFDSSLFPLVVNGHFLNGTVDLKETRRMCNSLFHSTDAEVIVVPGYGGKDGGERKTLGRGGSDTANFGYVYGFRADQNFILTDVEGFKEAIFNGKETKTVKEVDIAEVAAGAFYGAKLPSGDSLEPLIAFHSEGANPEVYIAHHQNPWGEKSRIVKETSDGPNVKFVAGRKDIMLYRVRGNINQLLGRLDENGVDYYSGGTRRYANIVLNQKGKKIGESEIDKFAAKSEIVVEEKRNNMALVGIIGEGVQRTEGIASDMLQRLRREEINIEELTIDISPVSFGTLVSNEDLNRAIGALYDEFFSKAYSGSSVAK